ncbi:LysR family transcriptional regulator [Gemmobacter fulvus]|uniref:LysR family transcriptional regulator n=1 Tax=Gemmobacter fulvus TaxID=2840474 RepID=A0A975P7M7_9RHOB|nr:LysR family transcriptional regulator [Gemmobacter fulvus]MBT9245369.1 LysR family transcriptional regulator [Gemmobacter fulvus]QWK90316.1 LysR family transcriptional regulator [Gemmobacter fulvus]
MNSWDDYRYMIHLHRHRTMSAVARVLGSNVATVSRRIEKISEAYGFPVFFKRADGWEANPDMLPLLGIVDEFERKLHVESNNLRAGRSDQVARITIGCPDVVTSHVLLPGLRGDGDLPARTELNFLSRAFETGLGPCDIVLSYGRPEQGRLIARRAGHLTYRLYRHREAAPGSGWVALEPAVDGFGGIQIGWTHFGVPPVMRLPKLEHAADAMVKLRQSGPLPDVLASTRPDLEPIPHSQVYQADLWLKFHESRRGDLAIHRAADWIVGCFRALS